MTNRSLGRRELLGIVGVAALAAACGDAGSAPAAATSSKAPATSSPLPTASAGRPTKAAPSKSATPASAADNGQDVSHGPTGSAAVALTFHGAGADSIARGILAELGRASAHVTVFAVGSWLDGDPTVAKAFLDGGHELGNHTYHHKPMRSLGATEAKSEVERCAAVLQRLTGTPGAWFRPSGTPSSTPTIRAAARAAGYPHCVTYNLDSLDYTDPGAAAVTRNVLSAVRGGDIVSLHLGHAGTVTALPAILAGLAARSLRPVTVAQLLS